MKKEMNSLTIKVNKTEQVGKDKISLMVPGILILTGLWCVLWQEWSLGSYGLLMIVPAWFTLYLGICLNWEKKWQSIYVVGMLAILIVLCVVLKKEISGSIAALMEKVSYWKLIRTGTYTVPYETTGDLTTILFIFAGLSGFFVAGMLKAKTPIALFLLTILVLISWMCSLVENGWFIGIYMLGVLIGFAKHASGLGKSLYYSGVISVVLASVIVGIAWIVGFTPKEVAVGEKIESVIHSLRWEKSNNPMPEGDLRDVGAYRPKNEETLEVTMEEWTPLYLRGYVGGEYTYDGWKTIDSEKLAEYADDLYAIQENFFFASDQIANAWESIEEESENSITINVLDACHANTYLPYGAGNVTEGVLDPLDLGKEGASSIEILEYSADLYAVEDSYLLQGELAKTSESDYRSAESAYRDWIYEQYLSIPENVYEVLTKYFTASGEITTVQAKQRITKLLGETIEYNENILTEIGKRNFPSYVIEVSKQGYSVHYATLATLLLRCCGIPARYVEGYVVKPEQAELLSNGETLKLTQRNSHAWAEYYLDGVGWLPFDATPGYEDILEYELPTEGVPSDDSGLKKNLSAWKKLENQLKKTPQVEEEEMRLSQQTYIRQALNTFILLVILAIVVLILRTVLLRRRLRMRLQKFYGDDYRIACACILSYMQELAKTFGTLVSNPDVRDLAKGMAEMLGDGADVSALEQMLNEVWFSKHTITVQQQEMALGWLETAKQTWKEKMSVVKRFKHRFITCKIL